MRARASQTSSPPRCSSVIARLRSASASVVPPEHAEQAAPAGQHLPGEHAGARGGRLVQRGQARRRAAVEGERQPERGLHVDWRAPDPAAWLASRSATRSSAIASATRPVSRSTIARA